MRVLILAGGFARRMGKLGEKTPKSLLPVAGRPVIEHILEKVRALGSAGSAQVSTISVSTNKKFEQSFMDWMGGTGSVHDVGLVVEPVTEEGQKLGSIGALQFFIEQENVDDDLLVINGDNIFQFSLNGLVDFFREKNTFVFGVYDTRSVSEAMKMGVVLSDQNGMVMDFEEKPGKPKSTTVSTGIYMFPRESLPLIKQYIDDGNSPDRMGDLLVWLMKRQSIHAFVFRERWFDIGSADTYRQAEEEFGKGLGG
jgi:glucose-1-phosphate thymidylyltransferase